MAINIALTINAETSAELKAALLDLAALYSDEDTEDAGAPAAPATTGRRGRPRKDATQTDASPATNASGAPASTPAVGLSASSDTGPTATTAASPSDGPTLDQVKAKMEAAMGSIPPLKLQEMLEAAGLPKRSSEMSTDQYAMAIEVFDKAIALG